MIKLNLTGNFQYSINCSKIPKYICNNIDNSNMNFFWYNSTIFMTEKQAFTIHTIAWDKLF